MQAPGTDNHNHNLLIVGPQRTSAPLLFCPHNIQPSVLTIQVAYGSFCRGLTGHRQILADVSLHLAEKHFILKENKTFIEVK